MSELFETAIVEKRNVLNELRSNNMTIQELRFFSIYLSKINPYDVSTRVVRFPIEDFQRIMNFGKLNLGQLKASTDSLLGKIVHIPDEKGGFTSFTLFKRCRVSRDDNDKWFVEINASDDALPLMFDFKNRYFTYELWNALRLKSPNQIRMYEILKQYEGLGKRELPIKELRELLGIAPNEYDRWNNFKVRVLDSCQQALKESTDICYTYERGKTGKGGKWLTIIFTITKNEDYIDQLTLNEFIDMQPEPKTINDDNISIDLNEVSEVITTVQSIDPSDEPYKTYMVACNNEFSIDDISIIKIALDKYSDMTKAQLAMFLKDTYIEMKLVEQKKQIKGENIIDRASYLAKMLMTKEPDKDYYATAVDREEKLKDYLSLVNNF